MQACTAMQAAAVYLTGVAARVPSRITTAMILVRQAGTFERPYKLNGKSQGCSLRIPNMTCSHAHVHDLVRVCA